MKKFLHDRLLPLLLCFSLAIGVVAYETPKAEAVAGVDDAVFGSMALASYMTATGVPLTVIEGGAGAVSAGLSSVAGSYAAATGAAASGEAVLGTIAAGTAISTAGTIILTAAAVAACAALVAWLISEKGVTEGGDAVEVVKSVGGFSCTACSKTGYLPCEFLSVYRTLYADWSDVFRNLGVNDQAFIMSISTDYFVGYFFDSDGLLWLGVFRNPYSAVNSSFFGFYDLSSLDHVRSIVPIFCGATPDVGLSGFTRRAFYSRSYAEMWDGFLTGPCFAFDWSREWSVDNYPYGYSNAYLFASFFIKESINSTWYSGSSYGSLGFYDVDFDNERSWGESFSSWGDLYSPTEFSFNSSALSVAVPETYAEPELATGKTMVINVNTPSGLSGGEMASNVFNQIASSDFNPTYTIGDEPETDPDLNPTPTPEPDTNTGLIESILEQIEAIPSAIAEKVGELFAPDEELITEITDTFKAKSGFMSTLKQLGDDLLTMTPETEPPVIWIHLEDAESEYGYSYGDMVKALDLSWYQKYKADVDRIISGFLWLSFLWLLFKRAASIIQGGEMLTEYSNDLTRGHREGNETKFQNWLWKD